ncbi:hypothetical protein J6590_000845 [Homalodisca vitripennis]|nr:hypothetical protein J6590_000845 [Homalodisca vitripennis]
MDWVVVPTFLFAVVVELHGRAHHITDFKQAQVIGRAPIISKDFSKDLHLLATLKRDYQAKFSALASQSAIRNRIFSEEPRKNMQSKTQPHINLYHRHRLSKPLVKMTNTNQIYIYTNPSNNVENHSNKIRQQPSIGQVHELYSKKNLETRADKISKASEKNHMVLLPNGFLADTAEVLAARRAHMKEVLIALAITANTRG